MLLARVQFLLRGASWCDSHSDQVSMPAHVQLPRQSHSDELLINRCRSLIQFLYEVAALVFHSPIGFSMPAYVRLPQ
jgi:hypothetical protein